MNKYNCCGTVPLEPPILTSFKWTQVRSMNIYPSTIVFVWLPKWMFDTFHTSGGFEGYNGSVRWNHGCRCAECLLGNSYDYLKIDRKLNLSKNGVNSSLEGGILRKGNRRLDSKSKIFTIIRGIFSIESQFQFEPNRDTSFGHRWHNFCSSGFDLFTCLGTINRWQCCCRYWRRRCSRYQGTRVIATSAIRWCFPFWIIISPTFNFPSTIRICQIRGNPWSIALKLTSRTNVFAICTRDFFMTFCPPIHRTYRWTLGRYGRNKKQAFYKFHFLSKFECKLNGFTKQNVWIRRPFEKNQKPRFRSWFWTYCWNF